MNVNARWIHEDLVVKTVADFATRALPDSVLAQWPKAGPAYPMPYEVSDAAPNNLAGRAYHVDVFLEMTDSRQPDAQVSLTVYDGDEGAYAGDVCGLRGGFDDPLGTTLEWSWEERLWVPAITPIDAGPKKRSPAEGSA